MRTNGLMWIGLCMLATGCGSNDTTSAVGGVSGSGLVLQIQLSPPDTAVAGGNISVTVEALNTDQNIATNFVGTVHLVSSDPQAQLPDAYTFTADDAGLKEFDVSTILKTAGSQTITVEGANGEISASATVTIKPAAAKSLRAATIGAPLGAGAQGNLVVTAYDAYNNIAVGYTGNVAVTTNNPCAVLPAAHTFNANDRGQHAFGLAFKKAGDWSLAAQDSNVHTLVTPNVSVQVNPASPNSIVFEGLAATTAAGAAQSANVMIYDVYNNLASNYQGTIHFNTNDTLATIPADYTLQSNDGGDVAFTNGFSFVTAATAQNLTVSIDANVRTTVQFAVTPLAVHTLAIAPSPNIVAGAPFAATVQATDRYGNVVPWVGTVHFTGSDDSATLPGDYLFSTGDHGSHAFTGVLTFLAAGAQNITVADAASGLASASATIHVAPAALAHLTFGPLRWVTANSNFTTQVYATDAYGNATVNFAGTVHVFGNDANFTTQSLTMNQNVGGALSLAGVHFGAAGTFVLSANNTVNGVTTNANFTVSSQLAFSNAQAANIVVGQSDFTLSKAATCVGSFDTNNLWYPTGGLYVDSGGKIWLPDSLNNRVVGYNSLPTASGVDFDFEIGEGPWPLASVASPDTLTPGSVSGNGGTGLVVVDTVNNRVLIWNVAPTSTINADVVVGQASFTTSAAGCTSTTLNQPSDAFVVGSRLFVSDTENNRVLIYGSVPSSTSGIAASWVLGQPDLATCSAGTNANQLHAPHGLWSNGMLLAVADSNNNRVLVWNDVSTLAADGVAANIVIGQSSMTTATAGSSLSAMQAPFGVFSNGTSLFVSDSANHRVLVYAAMPTQSGATASSVLGTAPGSIGQCSSTGSSALTLSTPYGIGLSGNMLIVGSSDESRYLVYRSN